MSSTRQQLEMQVQTLREEGWSEFAISEYMQHIEAESILENVTIIEDSWEAAHRIGSKLFNHMLFDDAELATDAKLNMFYRLLGARIDQFNFMQLYRVADKTFRFPAGAAELIVYFQFVDQFVQLIQEKYVTGGLYDIWDHQMRYWLSLPIIDFIFIDEQTQQNGRFSSERKQFEKWLEKNRIIHYPFGKSNPRLHNRYSKIELETIDVKTKDLNIKDQFIGDEGYHLEVVFNKDGKAISQWNVLRETVDGKIVSNPAEYSTSELLQIANTESVNYAEIGGADHNRLDVKPANLMFGMESLVRRRAKRAFKAIPIDQFNTITRNKWAKNKA